MRASAPTPRRLRRSASGNDSAQYVLPFLVESGPAPSEGKPDCGSIGEPGEMPVAKAREPLDGPAASQPIRTPAPRRSDRIDIAPGRPKAKQSISAPRKPPASQGPNSISASANVITLIGSKSGAWSAPELAELLGCTGKHIYALAKSGRMPHLRIGAMVRFDPAATAEWLRKRYIAA